MTTAQVVETSVAVNNNSPIQDYVLLDNQTQPTFEMTPGSWVQTFNNNNNLFVSKMYISLGAQTYSKSAIKPLLK